MKKLRIIALLGFLYLGCGQNLSDNNVDILISNVNIIDVRTGNVLTNKFLTISSDTINGIYDSSVDVSSNCLKIDGTDKFIIPGLWDMHAHLSFDHRYQMGLLLANGITGTRELWGVMDTINYIRNGAKNGDFLAPEIFTSGNIIDGRPAIFPGMVEVETEQEARRAVKDQVEAGVDFIKVYSNLSKDAYLAIADEVKKHNIEFGGHIPEAINTFEAIAAGQRTAEHLRSIQLTSSTKSDSLRFSPGLASFSPEKIAVMEATFSQTIFDSIVNGLAKSDLWLVPTLAAKRNYVYLNDTIRFSSNPKRNRLIEYIPKASVEYWVYLVEGMPELFGENFYVANQVRNSKDLALLPEMVKGGVKFLAGTDYGNPYAYPGFTLHEELEIFAENGMSNLQALQTATLNPAIFFNREDEMGTVSEGNFADLVLLNENPLINIKNTTKIEGVFLKGTYLNRGARDSLLNVSKYWAGKTKSDLKDNAMAYGITPGCAHNHYIPSHALSSLKEYNNYKKRIKFRRPKRIDKREKGNDSYQSEQ